MNVRRITIGFSEEDHRKIKVICAELGMTIKDFVLQSISKKVEEVKTKGDK